MHTPGRFVARSVAVLMLGITVTAGCDVREPSERRRDRAAAPADAPYEAAVEEGLGAAVAIIVDTSGSMKDAAPGDGRPKFEIAQQSIEQMLDATDAFIAKRPDFPIKIGLYTFSSDVRELRAIAPYDRASLRAALAANPAPGGGPAIADAMRPARSGASRARYLR